MTRFGKRLLSMSKNEIEQELTEYAIKSFGLSQNTTRNYVRTVMSRLEIAENEDMRHVGTLESYTSKCESISNPSIKDE